MVVAAAAAVEVVEVVGPHRKSSQHHHIPPSRKRLSQAAGLAFGLEQAQDVVLADRALDVTDDGTALVVHELDANLGDTTTGAGSAEDLDHLDQLNGSLGGVHLELML
jgi:hypothetical protein